MWSFQVFRSLPYFQSTNKNKYIIREYKITEAGKHFRVYLLRLCYLQIKQIQEQRGLMTALGHGMSLASIQVTGLQVQWPCRYSTIKCIVTTMANGFHLSCQILWTGSGCREEYVGKEVQTKAQKNHLTRDVFWVLQRPWPRDEHKNDKQSKNEIYREKQTIILEEKMPRLVYF